MEKNQKLLLGFIALIFTLIIGFFGYLFFIKKEEKLTDALRFKEEYTILNETIDEKSKEKFLKVDIPDDNLYVYKTAEEIIDVLNNETAIIYFGYAKCHFCRTMVSLLNDVMAKNNVKVIYYVDISNIEDSYEILDGVVVKITNGSSSYYRIIDILSDYLADYYIEDGDEVFNVGVKRLNAPSVVAVKSGKVVAFHEGTVDKTVYNEHLNEEEIKTLSSVYQKMANILYDERCYNERDCKN